MQCLQRMALKWKCLLLQGTKRCFSAVSRVWTSRTQMQHVIPSTSGWKMKQGVSICECFLCMAGSFLKPLRFRWKYWGKVGRQKNLPCSWKLPLSWPWGMCMVCVHLPMGSGSFCCSLPSYNCWEIQAEFSWSYAFPNIKDAFKQLRCLSQWITLVESCRAVQRLLLLP